MPSPTWFAIYEACAWDAKRVGMLAAIMWAEAVEHPSLVLDLTTQTQTVPGIAHTLDWRGIPVTDHALGLVPRPPDVPWARPAI